MSLATIGPCDEAAIRANPAVTPCRPEARPWILASTILASGMVFIDGTVVNVALPALQKEFNAGVAQAQWVVESYALLLTALLLLGGSMGDRFGRRRVFAVGVGLFGAASVFCGLSGTIEQLIWARAAQGVGGALLVPGSLALISASFPESIRGKAIGTWSGYTAMTAVLGPVLGGFLIEHVSWRYAFLINVPFGAFCIRRFCDGRDEASIPDAAVTAFPVPQFQRRQFVDLAALCGAGRQHVLYSPQSHSGAGIFSDRGRCGPGAVHSHHVHAVALGRRTG